MSNHDQTEQSRSLKVAWFFVNVVYWLGWVAAALLAVMVIAMWAMDFNVRYATLPVDVSLVEGSTGEILEPIHDRGSLPVAGFSNVRVRTEKMPGLQYMMLMPIILLAGFQWIVLMLRKFLQNVRDKSPFVPENSLLLNRIGWLVVVGGPVYGMFNHIYAKVYINLLDIPGSSIEPMQNAGGITILAGLIIVVIAQVYDAAVKMKADADLTI
ncbi:MAG: DUF2975 domain-containing protein [candidate division Zixibacteria bacterium]|nr:DUF2975 domain-containing protein [candidate division Zixibacteria bacterium]